MHQDLALLSLAQPRRLSYKALSDEGDTRDVRRSKPRGWPRILGDWTRNGFFTVTARPKFLHIGMKRAAPP